MSPISEMIMSKQETYFGRVRVRFGDETVFFPVRKTRNKVLQKNLLRMYLSLNNEQLSEKYGFENGQTEVKISKGSKDPELDEKYENFESFNFFTEFLHNMEKFSDWYYIDDDHAVSILNGFGDSECLVISVCWENNGFHICLDFQRYPKEQTILFGDKFIITNGYTFTDKEINNFLPSVPEPPKQKEPVCELNCCICFDDFEKVSYKCRTCNEGIVCKGCCKKMKGVKRCPICRS